MGVRFFRGSIVDLSPWLILRRKSTVVRTPRALAEAGHIPMLRCGMQASEQAACRHRESLSINRNLEPTTACLSTGRRHPLRRVYFKPLFVIPAAAGEQAAGLPGGGWRRTRRYRK